MRAGDRVRSTSDGQAGVLAEDETGRMVVRLDRPAEKRTVPYQVHAWATEGETRLTLMQVARIAYEADCAMRAVQGEYGVRGWITLKDSERQPWLRGLPAGANEARQRLYRAIVAELQK